MGFFPEGPTYYNYGVTVSPARASYFADAASDVDDDNNLNLWGLDVPVQNAPLGTGSALTGPNSCAVVLNDAGTTIPPLTNQVGPCGLGHGMSVF
jgi:hypothetical protein